MEPPFFQTENFKESPNLIHGFTTRHLGSQESEVAKALSVPSVFTLKQIHSNIVIAHSADSKNASRVIEGDALITRDPGVVIGIRTADCVPILLHDPKARAVAAIHAGWRGLIAGVIEKTIERMEQEFSSRPDDLKAAIGAALCETCFEVGPEVAEAFSKRFGPEFQILRGQNGKSYLDLREGCREVLEEKGVFEANIETLPYCNRCSPDLFYSYRNGDLEGRMLAFIGLE